MLVATQSFAAGQRVVQLGQVVADDDPAAVRYPHLFAPIILDPDDEAEETAVQGRRRRSRRG